MKKAIILALIMGLVAGSLAAPAGAAKKKKKKKKAPAKIERVVEFEYDCPCGVRFGTPAGSQGVGWQLGGTTGSNTGGGEIPTTATDLFVTAKAEDASGQPVRVGLAHDTDGDGLNNTWGAFCGETTEPIEVSQAEAVMRVFVTSGTCDDMSTPAFATGGSITFTFTNMP
jgi:uncharacterized membrane protein